MIRIRTAGIVVVIAVLAAVAIASTASGGGPTTAALSKQIKKLKRQVAAIQKQQGPAGGAGAPGTARAYGTIDDDSCVTNPGPGPADICAATKAKGITSVTRDGINYCVKASGIDPATTSAAVSVDYDLTDTAEEDAQAMLGGVATDCADGFRVRTERTGATVAGDATNIAFTIVIP
jgi:hypothetical protein